MASPTYITGGILNLRQPVGPALEAQRGVPMRGIPGQPPQQAALKPQTGIAANSARATANATMNLTSDLEKEIDDISLDKLSASMLGTGATVGAALRSTIGADSGGNTETQDDGSLVPQVDQLLANIPETITPEQSRKLARDTMGLTGKEGEEDAYSALMMFGLGLMATPGDLGQAIGKAGLNVMPQITQARKAQRARRKDVGMLAYNIREKNKAQRIAASAAHRKWYNEDTSLSVELYKIQQDEIKNHLAAALGNATPGTEAAVLKNLNSKSFANIFRNVREMSKNPDDPAAMAEVMGSNGRSLAALAISKALENGDIDQEDIGGQGQDPGWKTYFERHPTKPGWTRRRMISSVRAKAKHPKTGVYDWIEAGTSFEVDAWAPPIPGTPAVLHNFNPKTQMWEQTTSDGLKQKAIDELNESERAVFELMTTAEQATQLVDEGGAFATSGWLSATTKLASHADAIIAALPIEEQNKKGMRKLVQDFTNKYSGALDKHILKDLRKRKGRNSLVLNGNSISSQQGIKSWISAISDKTSREKIIAGMEKKDREMATIVFNNFAALNPKLQGLMFNMAYAVGRSEEHGSRLTDRDIANALQQLGGNKAGRFASPEIFKAVLHQKVRNVAANHQRRARQYPKLTGLQDYNIVARWGVIERDLNNNPVPLPTWFLPKTSDADQVPVTQPAALVQTVAAAGQQAQARPSETLRTGIINAPTIRDDRLTEGAGGFQQYPSSLAETLPFFAQLMIDENGQLRSKEETLSQMGVSSNPAESKQNRARIMQRMAARLGLDVGDARVEQAAKEQTKALRDFYRSTNKAALLKSYLEPSLERIE